MKHKKQNFDLLVGTAIICWNWHSKLQTKLVNTYHLLWNKNCMHLSNLFYCIQSWIPKPDLI